MTRTRFSPGEFDLLKRALQLFAGDLDWEIDMKRQRTMDPLKKERARVLHLIGKLKRLEKQAQENKV